MWNELLKHETIAKALIEVAGAIVIALIGWGSGLFRFIGKQAEIALDRRRKRADARPPRRTFLITNETTVMKSHFWQIPKYDQDGAATGFKAFVFVTPLVQGRIKITEIDARLPLRFRSRHVLHPMMDPFRGLKSGLSTEIGGPTEAAVNFYVRPPIIGSRPIKATVRLRDHLDNWHERKVTFQPQP